LPISVAASVVWSRRNENRVTFETKQGMYNAVQQDGVKFSDVAAQFNIFGGKSAGSNILSKSVHTMRLLDSNDREWCRNAFSKSPNHNQSGRGRYEAQKPPFTGVNIGKF
jgi:hypothetical protein